jgi:hypothetical protein
MHYCERPDIELALKKLSISKDSIQRPMPVR